MISSKKGGQSGETIFLDRTEELFQLVRNLQKGRHTLIVGEKGIGKSSFMREARLILSGKTKHIDFSANVVTQIRGQIGLRINPSQYEILTIEHVSPHRECLREIAEKLHSLGALRADKLLRNYRRSADEKDLSALGSVKLEEIILRCLAESGREYLIFLDNLDRITPGQQRFVENILDRAVICSAVTWMREDPAFKKIWASFMCINLAPLPDPVSEQLINHYLGTYDLHVHDTELYRREVIKASNGNPFFIKNILWHGFREKYISREEIQKLQQIDEAHYFNMGPIYIFGIAVFTLFKIYSAGTEQREFYIFFSILGFFAYLIFRVFRAFFLFRPQRHQ